MNDPNKFDVNLNPIPRSMNLPLEQRRLELEAGWIGRFFGIGNSTAVGIIGFISVGLVSSIVLMIFIDRDRVIDYIESIGPLLTGILGYLFGRRS